MTELSREAKTARRVMRASKLQRYAVINVTDKRRDLAYKDPVTPPRSIPPVGGGQSPPSQVPR